MNILSNYNYTIEWYGHISKLIIFRRWNPSVHAAAPRKKLNHRALDDIKESIKELAHYKKHMFQLK